jgi:hypothetical protein
MKKGSMVLVSSLEGGVAQIKNNTKKHSIIANDDGVWEEEGFDISFMALNHEGISYRFGAGRCCKISDITIYPLLDAIIIVNWGDDELLYRSIYKDDELNEFANNEGFESWEAMKKRFNSDFVGKLVEWDFFKCSFYGARVKLEVELADVL